MSNFLPYFTYCLVFYRWFWTVGTTSFFLYIFRNFQIIYSTLNGVSKNFTEKNLKLLSQYEHRRIIEICLLICAKNIESNIKKKVGWCNTISTPKDCCNSYHKFLLSLGYVRWKLASNHHDLQSYNKCLVFINIFNSMWSTF